MKKTQIQQLRNKGLTFRQIGKIFGVSRQRVHQILTNHKSIMGGRNYLAEQVRIRDHFICQYCGKPWNDTERRYDIHHLDPNKENDRSCENYKRFDEMITLCHKCHLNLPHIRKRMSKGIRKWWQEKLLTD